MYCDTNNVGAAAVEVSEISRLVQAPRTMADPSCLYSYTDDSFQDCSTFQGAEDGISYSRPLRLSKSNNPSTAIPLVEKSPRVG